MQSVVGQTFVLHDFDKKSISSKDQERMNGKNSDQTGATLSGMHNNASSLVSSS